MSELRSIIEHDKGTAPQELVKKVKMIFTYDWIFSTAFEKIVVSASVLWGLYSIGRWIYGFFV